MCMYVIPEYFENTLCHTWKKIKNDGNQKIPLSFSFDYVFIMAILRPFLCLCIVFIPITTATSCQDADIPYTIEVC